MKKKLLLIIATLLLIFPLSVNAKEDNKTNVYLFYGKECPHCEAEMKYFTKLLTKEKYKDVNLEKYEVWHNKDNADKMYNVMNILNTEVSGVPFLIIGTNYLVGYGEQTSEEIENILNYYVGKTYYDPVGDYLHDRDTSNLKKLHYEKEKKQKNIYKIPLLGKVNGKNVSLALISIIIGAVDGFNPCAMWILLFLLSLLISTKDRKKMWILGSTFILTSGVIYLFFMLSWLNVAKHTTDIIFLRYLIGVFALVFGAINLYRYIKQVKENNVGCDVTDANKKRKIMDRIRNILSENKMLFAIIGIMLLAISVNLIELLCSLGLPMMYTEILGINNLSPFEYGLYMFLYLIFFLLDDFIIFFIAMRTLKIKGISNKYMKYSHLIGGLIMVLIGALMLIKPEWLLFNF